MAAISALQCCAPAQLCAGAEPASVTKWGQAASCFYPLVQIKPCQLRSGFEGMEIGTLVVEGSLEPLNEYLIHSAIIAVTACARK